LDTELHKATGARIRGQRERLHLTREKLSEKAGLSVQFIADIEYGRKGFTVGTLKKLCGTLGVSADYIVFGETRRVGGAEITYLLEMLDERYLPIAAGHIRLLCAALAEK
jgi:transcriptional regulator with XRE-family HTH domain